MFNFKRSKTSPSLKRAVNKNMKILLSDKTRVEYAIYSFIRGLRAVNKNMKILLSDKTRVEYAIYSFIRGFDDGGSELRIFDLIQQREWE